MDELEKIKISYVNGELDPLREQLQSFISSNKETILQFKNHEEMYWNRSLDLASALKLFILKVRTIDIAAEMKDQLNEIEKDIGDKYSNNTEKDTRYLEWIRKNSVIWRGYRVLAIIYVFEQNREALLTELVS